MEEADVRHRHHSCHSSCHRWADCPTEEYDLNIITRWLVSETAILLPTKCWLVGINYGSSFPAMTSKTCDAQGILLHRPEHKAQVWAGMGLVVRAGFPRPLILNG